MMRTLFLMILILVLAAAPTGATQLSGSATVDCDGNRHVVIVACCYIDHAGVEGEYTGIVLKRRTLGICEPEVMLLDDVLPFELKYSWYYDCDAVIDTFELAVPHPDAVYLYFPYAVKADGSLYAIYSNCLDDHRSYAQTDCGTAPFLRGTVGFDFLHWGFQITPCEGNCWDMGFSLGFGSVNSLTEEDFAALAGESPWNLYGSVVDVYGGRTYCVMLGGPSEYLTRIERAPLGVCGSIPTQQTNWGSLKVLYR